MAKISRAFLEFKRNQAGFCDVTLAEFRNRILPLRTAKIWTKAQCEYALELADRGAAPALRQLCASGPGHAWCDITFAGAPGRARGAPMSRDELTKRLATFVRSSEADSWPPDRYRELLAYFDSNATIAQLSERKSGEAPAAPAPASLAPTAETGIPASDDFAAAYRSAPLAYKRVVRESLEKAACAAEARSLGAGSRRAPGRPIAPGRPAASGPELKSGTPA